MRTSNMDKPLSLYVHIAPNKKLYIGITQDIKARFRKDGEGYKGNRHLWKAIQKYGWNNFQHIVLLENLPMGVACECEKFLIAKYKSNNALFGYNLAEGGQYNSGFHFYHTEETKAKISKASKGHIISDEQKLKISSARKGIFHHTEETKQRLRQVALNMSREQKEQISRTVKSRWKDGNYANRKTTSHQAWNKGLNKEDERILKYCRKKGEFKHTQETKNRISASHKGRPAHNRKAVQCVETQVIYSSIGEAHKLTGINNIGIAAHNSDRTAGSFHWRFLDDKI